MQMRGNQAYYRINEQFRKRKSDHNINRNNSNLGTHLDDLLTKKTPIREMTFINETMDLARDLVQRPKSSFLIRVVGESMCGAGIESGDTLLVDKASRPVHGNIVVAAINNKLLVKRLNFSYNETMLLSENEDFMPIMIKPGDDLDIWGVVKLVIKDLKKD